MKKSIWLGGVLGGLAVFVWLTLSWMVLPLHNAALLKFKDEIVVTAVIGAQAPQSGMYLLPNPHAHTESLPPEVLKLQQAAAMTQWKTGPSALMAVRTGPGTPMVQGVIVGLVSQLVAGVLIAWLLAHTSGLNFWRRVGFVVAVGFTAGVIAYVPEWNWWSFSTAYIGAQFVDLLVGWFLGGLVIAKFSQSK